MEKIDGPSNVQCSRIDSTVISAQSNEATSQNVLLLCKFTLMMNPFLRFNNLNVSSSKTSQRGSVVASTKST